MHAHRSARGSLAAVALLCALAPTPALATDEPRARPVVVKVNDGGFHWTDAAVGAGAALAAGLMSAGLVLVLRPSTTGGDRR
jgi:hypothetical protein